MASIKQVIESICKETKRLRVDERSSDSYIGRDIFFLFFFSGKFYVFFSGKVNALCFVYLILRGLTHDFFKIQFICVLKTKTSYNIEQQKVKSLKKRDNLILKVEFKFQIFNRNESFTY